MLRALLRVTVASLLFGMTNAGYGQGPAFAHGMAAQGQAMGVQGRAFGHQMAAQGQAMGVQGRAFGHQMAAQGQAMGVRAAPSGTKWPLKVKQ